MNARKKILIAPLDWGLGHATRCIPIVQELLAQDFDVILAGDHRAKALLGRAFPDLPFEYLPGYAIRYAASAWALPWVLLQQVPRILHKIRWEHRWVKRMVEKYQLDAILSDNRYGLYHSGVYSIFLTHQVHIRIPQSRWLEKMINSVNHYFIRKFKACWIPDDPVHRITGTLGETLPHMTCQYIGWLSRFQATPTPPSEEIGAAWLAVLSGPEPQRTLLENKVVEFFATQSGKKIIVRGLPGTSELPTRDSISWYNHADTETLKHLLTTAKHVISRSGYSSVMDYLVLGITATLVPTPAQTEQEYVAQRLQDMGWFEQVQQQENFSTSLPQAFVTNHREPYTNILLVKCIQELSLRLKTTF
jgi:hypothetical protein